MDKKILIVDDEEEILNAFEQAFRKAGYTVHCAGSAEQAQDVLKREDSQVMFLDLKLPKMDGVELCKQIRKDRPLSMIYAVTGYPSLFELAHCREAGFDDYFTKPVNLETLLEAAENAFGKLDRWKEQQVQFDDQGECRDNIREKQTLGPEDMSQ